MNKLIFFLFVVALFVIERVFQAVFNFPIFVFPVFVILLILHSQKEERDIVGIILVSLIFDFFSGFNFGIYTLAIFLVCVTIYFLKTRMNINARTFISSAVLAIIFVIEFFLILSVASSPRVLISQAVWLILETAIWTIVLELILKKFKFLKHEFR